MKTGVILANGFEEVEAVGVIDILRRGEIDVNIISIEDSLDVSGAHNVKITCDSKFDNVNFNDLDMIILPGGAGGVNRIKDFKPILHILKEFNENNKYIAAICAAPVVLEEAGILNQKEFTCYKGFEQYVANGKYLAEKVVQDGNIITSNCVGSVFDFGFKLVNLLKGEKISKDLHNKMIM